VVFILCRVASTRMERNSILAENKNLSAKREKPAL